MKAIFLLSILLLSGCFQSEIGYTTTISECGFKFCISEQVTDAENFDGEKCLAHILENTNKAEIYSQNFCTEDELINPKTEFAVKVGEK